MEQHLASIVSDYNQSLATLAQSMSNQKEYIQTILNLGGTGGPHVSEVSGTIYDQDLTNYNTVIDILINKLRYLTYLGRISEIHPDFINPHTLGNYSSEFSSHNLTVDRFFFNEYARIVGHEFTRQLFW